MGYLLPPYTSLSSQKLISIVEVTNIRTYSPKTSKLRNIYTIKRGKWDLTYRKNLKIHTFSGVSYLKIIPKDNSFKVVNMR